MTITADRRLREHQEDTPLAKPPVISDEQLTWLPPVREETDIVSALVYHTNCGRYCVWFQTDRHDGDTRYVVGYKRTVTQQGGKRHTFVDLLLIPGQKSFYPQEFRDLGTALEAAEEVHCQRTKRTTVASNREELAPPRRPPNKPRRGASEPGPRPGKARISLFGHPVTAVLRWLGANDWKVDDVKKVLGELGLEVADSTIAIQLRAGKVGDQSRGEPAPITEAQANELLDLLED